MTAQQRRRRPVDAVSCSDCGMVLTDPYEFHPHVFCVLKKAGRDPWEDFRWCADQLGLGPLPSKPPLVRDLPMTAPKGSASDA